MIDNINQINEHQQGKSKSNSSVIFFYETIRLLYKDRFDGHVKINEHRNQKER